MSGHRTTQPRHRLLLQLTAACLLLATLPLQSLSPAKKDRNLLEHRSGFLGHTYSRLRPDPTNDDWLLYLRSPGVLQHAHSFYIQPVRVIVNSRHQKHAIARQDLNKLAATFTQDLREELEAGHYTLASHPGPGIMALRFAITNIEPNGGKTNAVVSGGEAVATHTLMPGAGLLIPRFKVGKASIEGEMLDSQSHQVDMAFMTSKSGRRIFSGLKAYEKWGDIDAALKTWAKTFRQHLDRAHST